MGDFLLAAADSIDYWRWYAAFALAGLLIVGAHAFAELTGWGEPR